MVSLRLLYVCVKVPDHHELVPAVSLFCAPDDSLNGGGVVQGLVASRNEPVPVPRSHLEADNLWNVLMVGLHHLVRRILVEKFHAFAVLAGCV